MVVRFTPSSGDGTPEEPVRRTAIPAASRAPATSSVPATGSVGERIAPVTYLPGARPSPEAAAALDSVERIRRGDVVSPHRRGARADDDLDADPGAGKTGTKRTAARASNVSLHQLARRGMSRWELNQVLERRDVEPSVANAELDRLESVGLLDDAALAVTLVYTQHTRKGLGRSAIAAELRRRHIDQDIIEDALSEIQDDDERERALELAHKRVGQLSGVDDETARRRLTGFLARKGYSNDIIRAALDSALSTRRGGPRFE
jgi:regulatory protein